MAWMSMLYQTYENNARLAGKVTSEHALSPIAHMMANAQVEIHLSEAGDFMGATVLEKGQMKTLIPVTEKSASRGAAPSPHPLCEMLAYIAKDFSQYLTESKDVELSEKNFKCTWNC